MTSKRILLISAILLTLAVALGAFGAHGLEKTLTAKAIKTYETGVRYHFYHAFGLMLIGTLLAVFPKLKLSKAAMFHLAGIILFSFNCYLYAVSGVKTFAMIVPLGGVSFMIGWILLALEFRKIEP